MLKGKGKGKGGEEKQSASTHTVHAHLFSELQLVVRFNNSLTTTRPVIIMISVTSLILLRKINCLH